jgi:hypothetical protein
MKYLITYNESNRYLNLKEVLNYVEDLSSDFTDEGFETLFGIMPGAIHHPEMPNFDENLDDIQIKMASMGKSVIYFKLDSKNIKDESFGGKLDNDELDLLITTITSIYKYLIHEGLIVSGLWLKHFNYYQKIRSETNRFNHFTSLDELVKSVRNYNLNSSTYVEDVRIAFTGQPYKEFDGWKLEESKDFKVDRLQATESDYEDIKEIIDDFNQSNFEGDNKDFEVVIHTKLFGRYVKADFGQGQKRAYLVMINDKNKSNNIMDGGFLISDVSELILRLMSEFGSESIMSRITFIGDFMRQNFTLTKDLLNNKPEDFASVTDGLFPGIWANPMSNLSFYIEII